MEGWPIGEWLMDKPTLALQLKQFDDLFDHFRNGSPVKAFVRRIVFDEKWTVAAR